MYYIYYDKDYYGNEHILWIKESELIDHKLALLDKLAESDFCPVSTIDGSKGCFCGMILWKSTLILKYLKMTNLLKNC